VQSLGVLEALDVVTDRDLGRRGGHVTLVVDKLDSESSEEAFGDGIVPAVALAAHARDHAALGERLSVVLARVGGEFKWSSQHLESEERDEEKKASEEIGSSRTSKDAFAWSPVGVAA